MSTASFFLSRRIFVDFIVSAATSWRQHQYWRRYGSGLTWTYDVTERLYGEISFGPSLNDGILNKSDHHRKDLGAPVLFRALSLEWRFDETNKPVRDGMETVDFATAIIFSVRQRMLRYRHEF